MHEDPPSPPRLGSEVDEAPPAGAYLFFRYRSETYDPPQTLACRYDWSIWRPSEGRPWPDGECDAGTKLRFLSRFALHHLGLFANSNCGALCIFDQRKLVHYSYFSPRYWRFPFLRDNDVVIGDTSTEPSHRRRGLALFALLQIVEEMKEIGRDFWYVVDRENLASISVAKKAGFECVASGACIKPWGIRLLGAYTMETGRKGGKSAKVDGASADPPLHDGPGPIATLPR